MTDEGLGQRAAVAYVLAMGIDWAKRTEMVPWISHNTAKLNRVVSVTAAFAQTAGFTFMWEGSVDAGGTLKVTVPALAAFVHFILDWTYAFSVQEFVSKAAIQPRAVEGVPVEKRDADPVLVSAAPQQGKRKKKLIAQKDK